MTSIKSKAINEIANRPDRNGFELNYCTCAIHSTTGDTSQDKRLLNYNGNRFVGYVFA